MKRHILLAALLVLAWESSRPAHAGEKEKAPPPANLAGKQAAATSFAKLAASLQDPIDLSDFMNEMTLKEFLGKIQEKAAAEGKELPIIVDTAAFKAQNPDAEDMYNTPIHFEKKPRQLPLGTALRLALSKVQTMNATYLIRQGHIEITTFRMADPDRLLGERVTARFEKRPLDEALDELSHLTGATITLDTRVADKAKTPVTASFKGTISLESAVGLLAEMADLQAEVNGSTLFVTTKAKDEGVHQKAALRLHKRRLDLALKDLARWSGVTIVLDPEVEGGIGTVTASFKPNASSLAAVRIVADQVGLSVAVLDNVYYVTTPDIAERLRKQKVEPKNEASKGEKLK